ncbi:hypothetical protein EHS25_000404 [Saitozyma podzolica]|uniref:Fungal lipase-type domain-containing protein n=1 Tax=Saitozyma podzolica TaxID=1890683 RepID=A0A427YW49_9TREE|nr:hypothetical protein EHS25_000404 [Saitozyma podzolica]
MLWVLVSTFAAALCATALPTRRSVTDLSSSQISAWTSPAYFASAAYCPDYTISAWSCGSACNGNAKPTSVTGGDGGSTPRFYIATLSDNSLVVAISGTNTSNDASIAVDLEFPLTSVSTSDFPGASGVEVHTGFLDAFERLKGSVTSAVQSGVSGGATNVLVTGHSLGGALVHLTATYLQKLLGTGVTVTAKAFASPRVGNQAWANYVDATLGSNTQHMINFNDDVPHVPPRDWGFQQSSGEVWILQGGTTYESCSGQENSQCSDSLESGLDEVALVASFVNDMDSSEHRGPYAGVK